MPQLYPHWRGLWERVAGWVSQEIKNTGCSRLMREAVHQKLHPAASELHLRRSDHDAASLLM